MKKINLNPNMVIKKYYELKNIENVGNYFNVSYTPIKRILIENNIEIPLRKYSINENYFNTIDSSENDGDYYMCNNCEGKGRIKL